MPKEFNKNHCIDKNKELRKRKITPKIFFFFLLQLACNTTFAGYCPSVQVLQACIEEFPPLAQSSLCAFRQKISFSFFKNIFDNHLKDSFGSLKTYQGFHLIGLDGDEYSLNATGDALKEGYLGRNVHGDKETYNPRMYVVKAVHLLSGVICGFHHSHTCGEILGALEILEKLPKKIIATYDRLYLSKGLLQAHQAHGSYFICRCKVGATFKEIINFAASPRRATDVVLDGVSVRLIKTKNPKTGEDLIFATNLPKKNWSKKKISKIYQLRWECETSNRDHALSLDMEAFHSKSVNGVLQELYASLLLNNILRLEAHKNGGFDINPDISTIQKTNFKFLVEMSFRWLKELWFGKIKNFTDIMRGLVTRNISKRKRLSRAYEREVKSCGKSYKKNSLVSRRA